MARDGSCIKVTVAFSDTVTRVIVVVAAATALKKSSKDISRLLQKSLGSFATKVKYSKPNHLYYKARCKLTRIWIEFDSSVLGRVFVRAKAKSVEKRCTCVDPLRVEYRVVKMVNELEPWKFVELDQRWERRKGNLEEKNHRRGRNGAKTSAHVE